MPVALTSKHFVTAIIVSHDGETWLPETVAALSKQRRKVDQWIAIDTGSEDASVKLLKHAGIPVMSADRSTGFGAAIKLAMESTKIDRAPEDCTEWIWLIHDDSAPSREALTELLQAVDDRPHVAMAGPKLRGWYDQKHLLEVGVSIASNGARWTGLEYREQDQGQRDSISDVLSVSSAGALIRREVFEELGGFDPELTLFRDDLDLGWRMHTAGHSVIAVPSAIMYHAEAATNERRSIDVHESIFHRPLLLDRRHAAYVLMANSSLFLTPVIALQLALSAILRALGFLFAKRPGYALDEIAAVFLVLIKPQNVIRARRARRKTRLVSSRVVSRFIPPRWQQLQASFERARDAVSRSLFKDREVSQTSTGISALDLDEKALEDADIELVAAPSFWRSIIRRPILGASLAVILISLIASRARFGDLVGGALPTIPASGRDLLGDYASSWHSVGLGSSLNTPPWVAVVAIASLITLFNTKLLITFLFIAAVPLAFLGAYRLARSFTELKYLSLLAALLYSFSPVTVSAINSGRLGTVVLLVIGPWVFRSLLGFEQLERISWRGIWPLTLIVSIICAFSPLTFLVIALWQLALFVSDLISFNQSSSLVTKDELDRRNARRIAIISVPILSCAPWTFEFLLHPSRILLDPGLNIAGGSVLSIVTGNPGGAGSIPIWLISPIILLTLTALFVSRTSRLGEIALVFLGVAALVGSREIAGHGGVTPLPIWVGSLIVIPTLAAIMAAVIIVDHYVPQLSVENFDYRHILLGLISIVTIFAVLGSMLWWSLSSSSSPLQVRQKSALPAFLSVSAQTEERFRTLVLRDDGKQLRYFITRDQDLSLGEPDVVNQLPKEITGAMEDLVIGSGVQSSQVLAQFGIRYLFLSRPYQEDLVRTIDGVGGFARVSATDEGISWKVTGALSHFSFISNTGQFQTISGDDVGAEGRFATPGVLVVAEKYDSRWKLIVNGNYVEVGKTENGLPQFNVSQPGDFILFHDGTERRAWISLQLLVVASVIILALPARRRRREISDQELS